MKIIYSINSNENFSSCSWVQILFSQAKEAHGPWIFDSRVLSTMFGLQREEVAGGWRKLHITA
jgi:hypothetical protein